MTRKKIASVTEKRQDDAYRQHLLGRSTVQIAEDLGCKERQVRNYLKAARERMTLQLIKLEGEAGVHRQFALLNHVITESVEAWEKSKAVKTTKTGTVEKGGMKRGAEKVGDLELVKTKTGSKAEDQIGDPAFLDRILKASAELRLLLGLDAPAIQRVLVAESPSTEKLDDESLRTLSAQELLEKYRATIGVRSGLGG